MHARLRAGAKHTLGRTSHRHRLMRPVKARVYALWPARRRRLFAGPWDLACVCTSPHPCGRALLACAQTRASSRFSDARQRGARIVERVRGHCWNVARPQRTRPCRRPPASSRPSPPRAPRPCTLHLTPACACPARRLSAVCGRPPCRRYCEIHGGRSIVARWRPRGQRMARGGRGASCRCPGHGRRGQIPREQGHCRRAAHRPHPHHARRPPHRGNFGSPGSVAVARQDRLCQEAVREYAGSLWYDMWLRAGRADAITRSIVLHLLLLLALHART